MNRKYIQLFPGVDTEELIMIQNFTKDLDDDRLETFASIYMGRRRPPDHILVGTIIGLLGVGGIQRFMIDQIGMGVLYLLTCGLCFIGTIIDLINYKRLAFEYNHTMASDSLKLTQSLK